MEEGNQYAVNFTLCGGNAGRLFGYLKLDSLGNIVAETKDGREMGRTPYSSDVVVTDEHGARIDCRLWKYRNAGLVPLEDYEFIKRSLTGTPSP